MGEQVFIITGASKGIGKGLAEKALSDGAKVVGISRTHSIEHDGYYPVTLDLAKEPTDEELNKIFGELEIYASVVLINNAGTLGDIAHLGNIENGSIYHLMNLNVSTPLLLMNEFIKRLSSSSQERIIINISSGAGKKAVDGWSGYCASKAAMDMASEVAAKEADLEKSGIIIKSIAPGVVDTNMQTEIRQQSESDFSSVDRFLQLKEENALSSLAEVAELYFKIIRNIQSYPDVLLDVRNV